MCHEANLELQSPQFGPWQQTLWQARLALPGTRKSEVRRIREANLPASPIGCNSTSGATGRIVELSKARIGDSHHFGTLLRYTVFRAAIRQEA
jgi:hypothetical protein